MSGNSIGFLRLLLATVVVYGHSWYLANRSGEPLTSILFNNTFPVASVGVRGFFFLSGFLLFESERRTASTRDFLWNRALRIYPALWACLVVTGVLLPWVVGKLDSNAHVIGSEMWSYVYHNAVVPRSQIAIGGLFPDVPRAGDLNGSLWTLPYEIGCYVMLAAFGWLGVTTPGTRWSLVVGVLLIVLYFWDVSHPHSAVFFTTDGRLLCAWFIVGALSGYFRDLIRQHLKLAVALAAVVLWILSCRFGTIQMVIGPFAMGAALLWLTWNLPLRGFELKVGGDYSYGLYIYAYPVQQSLAYLGVHERGIATYFLSSLAVTSVLAVASWHLVEKWALRFKARSASKEFPRSRDLSGSATVSEGGVT